MLSMKELQTLEIDISFYGVILSLLISTACAIAVKYVYIKHGSSLNNRINFSNIFPLLAITTTLVITVVKFSLALSLGLVGALSIVRFRAAIKEPEELVYLFLIIAIGLGAGAGQYQATVILTVFSISFILIERRYYRRKTNGGVMVNALQLTCPISEKSTASSLVSIFLDNNFSNVELKSYFKTGETIRMNYVFEADISTPIMSTSLGELTEQLPKAANVSVFHNTPIAE